SVAAYLITRTGTDDDPDHMPIPHGFEHHYPDAPEPLPTGYATNYDAAAVPRAHGFACLHCGIERAGADSRPRPGRRSDDGLCSECRDTGHPGIPDHDPTDHIPTRCAHITSTYTALEAQAKLRHDWRHAPSRRDRHAIADWVRTHRFPDTPADMPIIDVTDPVQMLTDRQLTQHIDDIHRRIALQANESTLFGAPDDPADDPTPTVSRSWLVSELADLHAEQHRRGQLTPEQTAAEEALRESHRPDTEPEPKSAAADSTTNHTIDPDNLGL
ncbi:hypothetical protein ABIA39_009127, partial [Nocardia sp. GAS34]